MKKNLFLLLLMSCSCLHAQSTRRDSLPKNEITASFLPFLVLFSGYDNVGRYGFYSFGYRRYLKNNEVLRASFNLAPGWNFRMDSQTYLETRDSIHIFSRPSASIKNRFQLNLGFEKIFHARQFMHAIGGEVLIRKQRYSYDNPVYWYPTNIDPNSLEAQTKYSHDTRIPGRIYNGIDSMYYSYDLDDFGLGIQLIYTLRYRINNYFYVSSSMGPYVMMLTYTYANQRGDKDRFKSGVYNRWDAHVFLISDVSLNFRF